DTQRPAIEIIRTRHLEGEIDGRKHRVEAFRWLRTPRQAVYEAEGVSGKISRRRDRHCQESCLRTGADRNAGYLNGCDPFSAFDSDVRRGQRSRREWIDKMHE